MPYSTVRILTFSFPIMSVRDSRSVISLTLQGFYVGGIVRQLIEGRVDGHPTGLEKTFIPTGEKKPIFSTGNGRAIEKGVHAAMGGGPGILEQTFGAAGAGRQTLRVQPVRGDTPYQPSRFSSPKTCGDSNIA